MTTRGRRQGLVAGTAVAIAVVSGPLLGAGRLSVATSVLLFVTLAQSWNVIGGYAGYPSFGQVAFSGVGGYVAAVLTARAGLSFWWALPAAAGAAAVFAGVVGTPLLRLRGNAFSVATLGVAAGTEQLVANLGVTGGGQGLTIPTFGPGPHTPYPSELTFYWLFLALAAVSVTAVSVLARHRFGLALRAIRADETAAAAAGVATTRTKVAALSLSAALAGAAGALAAFQQVVVFPASSFDITTTTLMVVMVVVGGRGTVWGPVIGAAIFETLISELRGVAGGLDALLLPALIIATVLLLPDGLVTWRPGRFRAAGLLDAARRYRL